MQNNDDPLQPTTQTGCAPATLFVAVVSLMLLVAAIAIAMSRFKSTVIGTRLVYAIKAGDAATNNVDAEMLTDPLSRRMNDFFRSGVSVNAISSTEVEVLLQTIDPIQISIAKDLVSSSGVLRFLIVANHFDHANVISLAQAESQSTSRDVIDDQGEIVGRWVTIDRETKPIGMTRPLRAAGYSGLYRNAATGEVVDLPPMLFDNAAETAIADWMQQQGIAELDLLTVVDPLLEVGGEDLSFVAMTFDQNGSPAIAFNLTDAASGRFFALTTNHAPQGSRTIQLGVVLDDELLTAPNILSPIRKEGRITGNFTQQEVERTIQLLKSGRLPAEINKTPLSQSQVPMERSLLDAIF